MKVEDLKKACKEVMEKIIMLENSPNNVTIDNIRKLRESEIELWEKLVLLEKCLVEKEEISTKSILSQQELERAENVLIIHLGLEIRIVRALNTKKIKTLRELYEYEDLKNVRKVGLKSIVMIDEVIQNMPQFLEVAERQRKNIELYDEELFYLLSEKAYKHIKWHYHITRLLELYNSIDAFCGMETSIRKEVEFLFERYK